MKRKEFEKCCQAIEEGELIFIASDFRFQFFTSVTHVSELKREPPGEVSLFSEDQVTAAGE